MSFKRYKTFTLDKFNGLVILNVRLDHFSKKLLMNVLMKFDYINI